MVVVETCRRFAISLRLTSFPPKSTQETWKEGEKKYYYNKTGGSTYREVSPVEGVDDEGLVAEVDDPGDPVAGLEGGHGAGDELPALPVLHHPVVVAVLHILQIVGDGVGVSALGKNRVTL